MRMSSKRKKKILQILYHVTMKRQTAEYLSMFSTVQKRARVRYSLEQFWLWLLYPKFLFMRFGLLLVLGSNSNTLQYKKFSRILVQGRQWHFCCFTLSLVVTQFHFSMARGKNLPGILGTHCRRLQIPSWNFLMIQSPSIQT